MAAEPVVVVAVSDSVVVATSCFAAALVADSVVVVSSCFAAASVSNFGVAESAGVESDLELAAVFVVANSYNTDPQIKKHLQRMSIVLRIVSYSFHFWKDRHFDLIFSEVYQILRYFHVRETYRRIMTKSMIPQK